jgi:hypothetical protein
VKNVLPLLFLATRRWARPPVILRPRNGRVLPEGLAFEWLSRFTRYTVRLVGPNGLVIERREVTGPRWEYPADAPTTALLRPGPSRAGGAAGSRTTPP